MGLTFVVGRRSGVKNGYIPVTLDLSSMTLSVTFSGRSYANSYQALPLLHKLIVLPNLSSSRWIYLICTRLSNFAIQESEMI